MKLSEELHAFSHDKLQTKLAESQANFIQIIALTVELHSKLDIANMSLVESNVEIQMSSRIDGMAHGYNQQPPRQSPALSRGNDTNEISEHPALGTSPSPAKRKDSLTRAQAVLTELVTDRAPKS